MEDEIRLLTKRKKGVLGLVFSRTGIILLLILLAIVIFFVVMTFFAGLINTILGGVGLFNLIVIVILMNTDMDSSAKITWILVVAVTSVFGTLFYIFTKMDIGSRTEKKEYARLTQQHRNDLKQDEDTLKVLEKESRDTLELFTYLNQTQIFPISRYNKINYYPLGEQKWVDMLEELKKAEHFIFMEYFIVDEGEMWGKILKILKDKAEQGVDVRLMYDGTCAIFLLPYGYPEMINELGIKCRMFAPLRPFVSTYYNYRDHRKILVVDGKVGFCGGVNLADEYINRIERFGHWKDTAIRIKGEAVNSLTHMFLNMWSFGEENADYSPYINNSCQVYKECSGYAMPYGFNPFDKRRLGEMVYIDILYRANSYVHIMTPYLILDDELLQSIKFAAERGVDVKLILPGIPDKKAVYALAKTYFKTLIESGVQIYLYTPGFVHAKVFVSDDIKAVVGTINLDYRSLYHHFECGTYLYDVDCIGDIEKDFEDTLLKCKKVSLDDVYNEKLVTKIFGSFMRLIAPLM